jgi:hypothetical protein
MSKQVCSLSAQMKMVIFMPNNNLQYKYTQALVYTMNYTDIPEKLIKFWGSTPLSTPCTVSSIVSTSSACRVSRGRVRTQFHATNRQFRNRCRFEIAQFHHRTGPYYVRVAAPTQAIATTHNPQWRL